MIWRGIFFQQFTFRGDNGQLFGERVRYPMNMFLFTIYFFVWVIPAIFTARRVVCSRVCVLPEKNFFGLPLDENRGRPHLVVNRSEEPEKNDVRAVETARFALITGSQPHVDRIFLVETFRWVKLLVSTRVLPTLV